MGLTDRVIDDIREAQRLQSEFSLNEGSTLYFLNLSHEKVKMTAPFGMEKTRTLGSTFILGHPGLGWLGYDAGSVSVGSQPYLGDSRSEWSTLRIYSPDNNFIETFDGSRFVSGNSTGDLGAGSYYLEGTEMMETPSIYLGSSTLSNIEFKLTGSTLENTSIEASPDGGDNWEACSSGSVETYNFTNTGSELKVRFTSGQAVIKKYEADYGLN